MFAVVHSQLWNIKLDDPAMSAICVQVYDLDDFVKETVTVVDLIKSVELLGERNFHNIYKNERGLYCISFLADLSQITFCALGWTHFSGYNLLVFRCDDVQVRISNGVILLYIDKNKYSIATIANKACGNAYFETIESFMGYYVLSYHFSLTDIVIILDKSGKPLGIASESADVKALIHDKSLMRLSAKLNMLSGKGWWNNLCL